TIGAGGGTPWIGQVNEVAWYNKALSQDRILAHYNLGLYGDAAPIGILTEPVSQTVVVGMPAQISVEPNGLPPFHYQWAKNSAPLAGQTNQTLSLASAYFTDSGNYSVTVTNLAGSTNSAAAVLTVIAQPSFAQVTNGLVVHLPLDGDYADYSGRGNSATPQGAPTFVPGIVGSQAVAYSTATGTSSYNYVSLLDTNSMNGTWPDLLFGSSTWSAAFWVKLTGGINTLPFLGNNNGGTYANNNTGCAFGADAGNGGGLRIAYGAGYYWSETNAFVADGKWHHIAVLSGPVYVDMYVDGQQVYSAAGNIALPYVGTYDVGFPFNIGQDGTGALAVDGTGIVDDMGIWNRQLTPLEIYSLFEVGKTYGRSLDQVAPVKLNLQQVGTNLDLSWQAGTLLYSTNVTTGYLPVPGATAPFYRTTASGKQCFYRVQQ
ncbi:MAG: hypothetical protein NT154_13555, partial [Verrucomicrobia bacterium]|nr:hypothetical protein [Verrucomicrobiota bacterium]